MNRKEFEIRVREYRSRSKRFELTWLVATVGFIWALSKIIDIIEVSKGMDVVLTVIFFVAMAANIAYAIRKDRQFLSDIGVKCPNCRVLLNSVSIWRVRKTGKCPKCSENFFRNKNSKIRT
jgi:hypothetical protein